MASLPALHNPLLLSSASTTSLLTKATQPLLCHFMRSLATPTKITKLVHTPIKTSGSLIETTASRPFSTLQPKQRQYYSNSNMSFFSPFYTTASDSSDPSFTPLFRLLSDWDDYSREVTPAGARRGERRGGRHIRSFVPKFDFRETDESFELHGELPGITKDNISVDFSDNQTIIIKGKVERSYEAGTPPAGWISGSAPRGAITEGTEKPSNDHKATVEDAGEEGDTTSATAGDKGQVSTTTKKEEPADKSRFWVSERSVGEFSRAFQFPTPVNTEGVTASLKDGILNISVPKEKKPTARRITVM